MKAEKLSGLVMRDHHEAVFVQVAFAKRKDVDELLELLCLSFEMKDQNLLALQRHYIYIYIGVGLKLYKGKSVN